MSDTPTNTGNTTVAITVCGKQYIINYWHLADLHAAIEKVLPFLKEPATKEKQPHPDSRRLDLFEERHLQCYHVGVTGSDYWVVANDGGDTQRDRIYGATLRAAIDAAIDSRRTEDL